MTRSSQASSRGRGQGVWAPVLLITSVLLTLLACGATQDQPAIKVGARTVGLRELEEGFWDYVAADSSARPDTASLRRYVQKTVDRVLSEILAEAAITELEPARFDRVQEFNEKTWVDVLRQEEFGSAYHPTDRELKAAWEKLGRRLHLRYMLLASEAEANEIRGALEQGAVFAKIAEQRSQDAESRAKGGDIGFVSYLDVDPLSRDDIFSLPVGGISRPIPWGNGYQIFQVVQEQANDGRGTLAEERRRLEQGIVTKSVRNARDRYEKMLLEKYHFKMDPEQVAWMTVLLRERTKNVNRGEDLKALGAQEDGTASATSSPLPWTGSPVPPADTSRVLATFDPPQGRVTPLLLFDQLFSHPMPTWPRFES
ncbi:MAG: peptidylprolyl isomerase, partial [Candidatus Eisenbacteria bacterium]